MAKKAPNRALAESQDTEELARMNVALLACVARGLKESGDLIQVMDAFGVSGNMIAKALGISPISVRTALHRRRKAKGR